MGEKLLSEAESKEDGLLEGFPSAEAAVVFGHLLREGGDGKGKLDAESKMRSLAALELLKRGHVERLVLSAGQIKPFEESGSIAGLMRDYLIERGADGDKLLVEGESKNTTESIERILEILESENINSVIWETNEYHLERVRVILEKVSSEKGFKLKEQDFVAAEDLLKERSPHYQKMLLDKRRLVDMGHAFYEFIRRVSVKVDLVDKIITAIAKKVR